ncbi:sensor histidine kinase [Aerolutibacter daejeonensis]|uniref:sensor histidine kinase n=1 Tax=Aerolutibacter daejeonensis TaxID=346181 RepID=UPI00068BC702|nr:ATP-binding protein [Lysobacter daejeonensis]
MLFPHLAPDATDADRALRRELYFFTLYRVFEAALLVFALFGPLPELAGDARHPVFARALSLTYLFVSVTLFLLGHRGDVRVHTVVGVAADLSLGILAIHALPHSGASIALMLAFNVGAAALLLRTRYGVAVAGLAAAGLAGELAWSRVVDDATSLTLGQLIFTSTAYLALAGLTSTLGRQLREGYSLAESRGAEAAQLTEVNELIIRRMRTGVLLVDGQDNIRLANEAASLLMGDAGDADAHGVRHLGLAMPELARRLKQWRAGDTESSPMLIAPDQPEVVPRFTRLLANSDQVLIFLDDTALAARRAESLTLATLGRFSASLAHEIRNPLAAINYAVQLLEESPDIPTADRRLLEIIRQQGSRMNGIVENVLGLARREHAKPEHVDLGELVRQFVEDYRQGHPLEGDTLQALTPKGTTPGLIDPRQLQQVLTVLVYNALTYGRMPGEPARVNVRVADDGSGQPLIEVLDRGPGIPERVQNNLFRPFFTTSSHGTGLGLYIARELCRANQASLDYVPVPGGGACFRLRLQGPAIARRA